MDAQHAVRARWLASSLQLTTTKLVGVGKLQMGFMPILPHMLSIPSYMDFIDISLPVIEI
jgi:hypothetical protein